MAKISKLRLGQIQDESDDFAAASVSHVAAPETLHDMLANLAVNMENRFGAAQSNLAIANQLVAIHDAGTLARRNDGNDILVKQEDTSKAIRFESADAISGSAVNVMMEASSLYDVRAENYGMVANTDFFMLGSDSSFIELDGPAADLSFKSSGTGGNVKIEAAGLISGSASEFRMDASTKIDMDAPAVEINGSATAHVIADSGAARFESLQANVEIQAGLELDIDAASKDENITGDEVILVGGTRTETVTGDVGITFSAKKIESVTGKVEETYSADYDKTVTGASLLSFGNVTETGKAYDVTGESMAAEYTAAAGYELIASAGPMSFLADGAGEFSSKSDLLLEGDYSATATLAGGELFLSASASHLNLDDAWRSSKSIGGTYAEGIELAASAQVWTDFEATFGEVSLLEAVRTAALGGTPDAADYVWTVTTGGAKAVAEASAEKYTNGGNSSIAATILSGFEHPCTDLDGDEISRSCAVFLNGQKLALNEDYTLDTSVADKVKVEIDFDLELGDIVVVEIG